MIRQQQQPSVFLLRYLLAPKCLRASQDAIRTGLDRNKLAIIARPCVDALFQSAKQSILAGALNR